VYISHLASASASGDLFPPPPGSLAPGFAPGPQWWTSVSHADPLSLPHFGKLLITAPVNPIHCKILGILLW